MTPKFYVSKKLSKKCGVEKLLSGGQKVTCSVGYSGSKFAVSLFSPFVRYFGNESRDLSQNLSEIINLCVFRDFVQNLKKS